MRVLVRPLARCICNPWRASTSLCPSVSGSGLSSEEGAVGWVMSFAVSPVELFAKGWCFLYAMECCSVRKGCHLSSANEYIPLPTVPEEYLQHQEEGVSRFILTLVQLLGSLLHT